MLLVSSCRHPGRWVVPSGGVEPGEDSKQAAIREVVEEVSNRYMYKSSSSCQFNPVDKNLSSKLFMVFPIFSLFVFL